MFFNKTTNTSKKGHPRGRSLLGRMLNPEFGAGLKPIGDTANMFVNLVAMIFAMNGLFPKNHPIFTGTPGAKLSLLQVYHTARSGLSFTREGMPKVFLFYAVIGAIGFSILTVLTMFMIVFMGSAHAASADNTSTFFRPESHDLAKAWIDYLFLGIEIPDYVTQSGQKIPQAMGMQTALIAALAFYSNAILIIAAFILFYHLVSMVVETAHHGEAMGKRANKIWAPIRLVVAIGLLVPISASGLNTGQFIVVKIAQLGSGLATQVWNKFNDSLLDQNSKPIVPRGPYIRPVVHDIIMMEACKDAFDNLIDGGNGYTLQPLSALGLGDTSRIQPPVATATPHGMSYVYQTIRPSGPVCGKYLVPTYQGDSSVPEAIKNAAGDSLGVVLPRIKAYAKKYIKHYQDGFPEYDGKLPGTSKKEFDDIVIAYQTDLQQRLANAVSSASADAATFRDRANQWKSEGWVSAGAWFNTISRIQGNINNAARDSIPQTTEPKIDEIISSSVTLSDAADLNKKVAIALEGLDNAIKNDQNLSSGNSNAALQSTAELGFETLASSDQKHGILDKVFGFVDWLAQFNGVWATNVTSTPSNSLFRIPIGTTTATPNLDYATMDNANQRFTLAVELKSANPFGEIAALGHANLNTAYDIVQTLFEVGITGGVLSTGSTAGSLIPRIGGIFKAIGGIGTQALQGISGILSILATIFFTAGFAMAFIMPIIPFMHFFFAVIAWVASLFEAIIFMPLVALAHLTVEGDGLPGQNAKAAYFFLFHIFLRPVLMIFGLISGLIIFGVAVTFMNKLYAIAVVGGGGFAHGHLTLSRLIYSIMYVVILFFIDSNCFKLISWFPENAMKWMGQQGLQSSIEDGTARLDQASTVIAGYASQQAFPQIGAAGQGVGAGLAMSKTTGGRGAETIGAAARGLQDITHSLTGNFSLTQGSTAGIIDSAQNLGKTLPPDRATDSNVAQGADTPPSGERSKPGSFR